ncbi:uncharacterized protein [Musca autumnalis]|uniref:uncharacterized protein n=1 Tax=Musca autumnalis TaxID=221902 RepID=UPI003CF2B82F
MNSFVLIACATVLLSCAHARPDVSLGYHYHPDQTSGGASVLSVPDSSSSSSSSYEGSSGFGGSSFGVGGGSQFNSGGSSYSQSSYVVGGQEAFGAPVITKHFYLHTAPEDNDGQEIVKYINIGRPQKNYRVVFIDAPSNTNNKAKVIANVAPTEEKTAIYVLSKKNNALDINTEVVTPAPVNNKPEVFFIKYKTPEEAIHAQHTIQAQYDALGGTSESHNEGTIPVSSVIGSLGGSGGSDAGHGDLRDVPVVTYTGSNTQQTYLPANHK